MRRFILATSALAALAVAAPVCAQTVSPSPTPASATASAAASQTRPDATDLSAQTVDPWEHTNRGLFHLNKGIDRAIVRPSAVFYQHAITHPVREGVHNVVYNLGEPVTFLNDLVQIRPIKAGKAAVRFVTNSTIGILGIFDVAGAAGLPIEPSGFAETLGRYGAPQGPYIFLPVFGPSSVRDLTGRVVDVVTDPFTYITYKGSAYVNGTRTVAAGLDRRVAADPIIKNVNRTATDPYATLRSGFLQSSNAAVYRGGVDVNALPDFGPEPGANTQPKQIPPKH